MPLQAQFAAFVAGEDAYAQGVGDMVGGAGPLTLELGFTEVKGPEDHMWGRGNYPLKNTRRVSTA